MGLHRWKQARPRVGSGVAIFKGRDIVAKAKLKLDKTCSINQAEQFAIVKAVETIESLNSHNINPKNGDHING
jgi:hypothetical protein